MEINSFSGKYAFLSNFHMEPIKFEGFWWPSVEHVCKGVGLNWLGKLLMYIRHEIEQERLTKKLAPLFKTK